MAERELSDSFSTTEAAGSETWVNAVIVIHQPLADASDEELQEVQSFTSLFADDPKLLISVTTTEHGLRAKIQHPLDLDPGASQHQRQAAVRQAALDLGRPSEYWWEEVDNFGQLQAQGPRTELRDAELDTNG